MSLFLFGSRHTGGHRENFNSKYYIMEIAKYIFIIVASVTLFGIIGGLAPDITMAEMAVKAVFVGLIFATGLVLREAKTMLLEKIS